jgi:protein gp37
MSVTSIEWTKRPGTIGETWNPTTGCNKVDRGCKNCYAETMHRRLQSMMPEKYSQPFLAGAVPHPETLGIPLQWRKPRTVFVDSMSDLFHHAIPFSFISEVFKVMAATQDHTYLILTKRPERAVEFWFWKISDEPGWMVTPNIWMGTSVNDQESADKRVPDLLKIEAAIRFISYEPATGAVDLSPWLGEEGWWCDRCGAFKSPRQVTWEQSCTLCGGDVEWIGGIDWVICGGESGHKAVPMHPNWARSIRDACAGSSVPFFFKQWGNWEPVTYYNNLKPVIDFAPGKNGYLFPEPALQNMRRTNKKNSNLLDGQLHQNFPEPLKRTI